MSNITALITKMTLEEKAALCSGQDFWHTKGIERLGIPSIMVTDGPHGLRKVVGDSEQIDLQSSRPATCFPTASALAATWNRALITRVGAALAEECRAEKVGVILGPGANIKRSPLCGRNFEYFSEDPYLSGEMAKSHINGVQSLGIGTSLKHFAANNQEYRRMTIDSVVDERALREIYLAGFEIAVREAQPWTVMGAYNRLNGTYCCEHPDLLGTILKEEWGHLGLVVTDWGAMNEPVDALIAGLELEMPGSTNGNQHRIVTAVQDGRLDKAVLDQAVERILKIVFRAHETLREEFSFDPEAHHALARQVAGEGAVLLKNEGSLLPLDPTLKIALLGAFAKTPRYQGAGSSLVNPSRMDTLYGEMITIAGDARITYAPGYYLKGDQPDDLLIQQAVEIASQADIVVINAGLPESFEIEGIDRQHMKLPRSHNRLIEAISACHDKVVIVLSNGSPVEMPWVGQVQAVLEGYLGGQAGAGAIADLLYGIVNPSGKLAETFPLRLEDTPSAPYFPGGPVTVEYRESLFVGYRFYNTVDKEVLYPFGHGLSYTTFAYQDITLSQSHITDQETITVRFRVKNTGAVEGQEIVQLYIRPRESKVFRPRQELKGFDKITLLPGEEKQIEIMLDRRAFAFYNTAIRDWHVESGSYQIQVGASSRDIRLTAALQITSSQKNTRIDPRDQIPAYLHFPADARIAQQDFETLLGKPVPVNKILEGELYTMNTCIADMQGSFVGRQLKKIMQNQLKERIKQDPDSPNSQMMQAAIQTAPPRLIMMFTNILNRDMMDGLMEMINGRFFKGLLTLLRAARQRR